VQNTSNPDLDSSLEEAAQIPNQNASGQRTLSMSTTGVGNNKSQNQTNTANFFPINIASYASKQASMTEA